MWSKSQYWVILENKAEIIKYNHQLLPISRRSLIAAEIKKFVYCGQNRGSRRLLNMPQRSLIATGTAVISIENAVITLVGGCGRYRGKIHFGQNRGGWRFSRWRANCDRNRGNCDRYRGDR